MKRRPTDPPELWRKPPENLEETLVYLNLSFSHEHYKAIIAKAATENLSHEEFLKRLLSAEAAFKFERQVARRLALANFPFIKTLEEFDWAHAKHIPKAKILEAAQLRFIERKEGFVFIADNGLGKSHLAIALGYKAALAGAHVYFTRAVELVNHLDAAQADHSTVKAMRLYTRPALLIIDEVARHPIGQKQGEHLFHVLDARYERGSTILCTNRAFRDWGKVFEDQICAKGIIDKLIHHSEVIRIEGVSYRIKDRKTKSLTEEQP